MLARLWRRETEARSTAQPALLAAVPDRRPELAPCLIVPNFRARSPAEIAVPKRRRRRIQVESLYREVEPEPRRHARALSGFHVLEAAGGAQALHLLANGQSVAAIVTDVRMPLMDLSLIHI